MSKAGLTRTLAAVLFDLDGTLVDSAPDLAGTANDMREARGLTPLPYLELRPHAGSGARGMLGTAFGLMPGHTEYLALRDEFHDRYEQRMLQQTVVFPTVPAMLQGLQARGLSWAVVTNKSLRFAQPLVQMLLPQPTGRVVIGGDSTPHAKPHPAPLLEAARRLGLEPGACAYVGDDPRDMQAARAAGMAAWAAAWGYLGTQSAAHEWGADVVLPDPDALLQSLELA